MYLVYFVILIHYSSGFKPYSQSLRSHNNWQCNQNNADFKFEEILNIRDLSSASKIGIHQNTIFRTACVSKGTEKDISILRERIGIKTFIDLRSVLETDEDGNLSCKMYEGFSNYKYNRNFNHFPSGSTSMTASPLKRYFIALASESLIKKGVFFRFRKRTRFLSLGLLGLSIFSRRAEKKVRGIFLDKINSGGLLLLNELLVDASGKAMVEVLKIMTEPSNLPVAFYCTAGKDRTGLIAMLVLHVLGASDEEILDDYVLSDSVYGELNNSAAMVASLKQVEIDPEVFLRAKREVMQETMTYIRSSFGSIDKYLDKHGFDETWRHKLRFQYTMMRLWADEMSHACTKPKLIQIFFTREM